MFKLKEKIFNKEISFHLSVDFQIRYIISKIYINCLKASLVATALLSRSTTKFN